MKNFEEVDLPTYDLLSIVKQMQKEKMIDWSHHKQVCINSVLGKEDVWWYGSGSLFYDWENAKTVDGQIVVPNRKEKISEEDFISVCTVFKDTVFDEIYQMLKTKYKIGRVRLMKSNPKNCMSWHKDDTRRLHYPIKTQEGCFMVIDNELKHLQANKWYITNTLLPHTAFNASKEERIHLVVNIL